MSVARVSARLSGPLAQFVERMAGEDGLYETPSEYIRDPIRRDMERCGSDDGLQADFESMILEAYRDVAAGRFIESTGDFKADTALFEKPETEDWR